MRRQVAAAFSFCVAACTMTTSDNLKSPPLALDGGVLFVDSDQLNASDLPGLWKADWRILSQDPDGRSSLAVTLTAGSGIDQPGSYASDVELFVRSGSLQLGRVELRRRDYAMIPAGAVVGPLTANAETELLFFSSESPTWTASPSGESSTNAQIVHYQITPWKGGEVSKAAGEDIPLRIKHYRNDPVTGARTFLVQSGPESIVPWERHSIVEEGFLIEGDYQLAECLPQGKVIGQYKEGGYFYRPPGIIHSGPDSFTRSRSTFLIRTPAALDVEFLPDCDGQP